MIKTPPAKISDILNKKEDKIEATLLTFKVALDVKGNIWTDIGGLPAKEIKHVFYGPKISKMAECVRLYTPI